VAINHGRDAGMKFNLDCFALVQVRGLEEDDLPSVTIHGFFASIDAALAAVPELRSTLAANWANGLNNFFGVKNNQWKEFMYDAGQFYVFTLTDREFTSFLQLEDAIENAAICTWKKNGNYILNSL
jgi:hypothetical protein